MARAWKKFYANKRQLCDKQYRLGYRLKLFDAVVTSTALYGSGCWTMTTAREAKLRSTQRRMLMKVLRMRRRKATTPGDKVEDGSVSSSNSSSE